VEKRWVYDGQYRVAAEVDGAGTVTSRFVYGSQSHSPDYLVRGGVTYVYVKSHLGSVKLVVDATTRAVVQRLDYDAWGQVTEDTSPGFQPFGFAGGVYDVDTRLTHFGFRDYDAQAGVWTSKDPIRLVGGLSAFDYAEANPIQLVDRDGLRVVRGAVSSRAFAAYNVWKASGRFSYIWKLLEADPNVDFVLNDKAYGDANAATYRNGCTADGRPQVNIDFFWKNIDSFRRSNPSWSEAGIVVHEFAHAQSYIRNGEAWFDGLYGVDASVTNAVEDAAEYYQDAYDGHPGRLAPGRAP
jgi:RHS repeat-associated protein